MTEIKLQPFLGKEWLVKTSSASPTPYLFKFVSSTIDLTCCVLFTDTKSVWIEGDRYLPRIHGLNAVADSLSQPPSPELSSQLLARRWRQHNPGPPSPFSKIEDEDEWRLSILDLLTKAHTLGGVSELSFEVVDTNYSDIAFTLECDSFKWRWETCFVGYKISADVISKQLVLPLISTNHLLFSSPESVQDMADADVEKAVDKVGRTARRAVDTHVKNALSKPRVSTILRRMTAIFNSLHELPKIISTVEEPSLDVPSTYDTVITKPSTSHLFSMDVEMTGPSKSRSPPRVSSPRGHTPKSPPSKPGSATESSDGEEPDPQARQSVPPAAQGSSSKAVSQAASRARTPEQSRVVQGDKTSDDDSSPLKPPPKKAKPARASSYESDSESERRARIAQLKGGSGTSSGMGGGLAKRGVRQPIKRGGKRF